MSGRKRFSLSDDIALVKEVLYVNPFLDPARWLKIADRLSEVLGRYFNIRSVRERLNLILLRFLRDQKKKIKSSGTEEEQSELEDLLQQAADIARECGYTPPPSTARQLAERDGIKKRATRNSVARPPAKRRVDNREDDALAAYAEFTAGDGVEPDGASTSQAQTLLNSLYEPENIEIHMDLPDCELEDNPTASCPAPDRIATAAPSRAQTPTSSPSDVAAADSSSSLLLNLFTCDLLDYQAMQLCMGAPLIPTLVKPDGWPTLVCLCKVHSGTLRQHMPSLRPTVIGTLQSRTVASNLNRAASNLNRTASTLNRTASGSR
ncbi:hypothetical protein MRX96_004893 [Rhipicephalus microplus]